MNKPTFECIQQHVVFEGDSTPDILRQAADWIEETGDEGGAYPLSIIIEQTDSGQMLSFNFKYDTDYTWDEAMRNLE